MLTVPRRQPLKSLPEVEVAQERGQLSASEWSFRDGRHRGFVMQAGKGRVELAEGEIQFTAPALIWLPVGTAERFVLDAGSRGVGIAITEVGLAQAVSNGAIAEQIRRIMAEPLVKGRIEASRALRLTETLDTIAEEISADLGGAQEAVVHLLKLFFIAVWRLSGPAHREIQPLPRTIALHFLQLVELHLRDHWNVARYAAEIGTTADQLNTILRRITGSSPLSLIHTRILVEADAMLDSTSMPISRIAEDLGFSDPAYFSRFYKRLAGQSPNRRRRDVQSKAVRRTYAAWP